MKAGIICKISTPYLRNHACQCQENKHRDIGCEYHEHDYSLIAAKQKKKDQEKKGKDNKEEKMEVDDEKKDEDKEKDQKSEKKVKN